MIILADSGSTKTHWCLMAANGQSSEFMTDGINPFYQTQDAMRNSIVNQLLPQMGHLMWAGTVTKVFFYGAGCTPEKSPFVERALKGVFKDADVQVESDIVGAARGLLQHKKGIACILGTGSNSCLYDGEQIVKNVPSLGFILGDEGGGAVLGKRLVADIFKNQLGSDLKEMFIAEYGLTQADVIEHVYRQPFPNRYLASLSKFCADHLDDKRIYDLVYDHFTEFVVRNLEQYYQDENDVEIEDTKSLAVGFIGGIAYYYRPILQQVMDDMGFTISHIMVDPIEGLKEYHRTDVTPTQE
ncbi:MAG: ATPase [Paludibacteraceae bacterium]|nr:ATPase [Paludibacteraceae bacterium]